MKAGGSKIFGQTGIINLEKYFKRLLDIVFSIIVLIPFAILILPITACLIKLSSPGPVFFVQKRTGRHHKEFNCYKLRSMHLNQLANIQQATEQDARITKIGYFLRVFHIDEIPQLYNVLKGEMSIIGPRPHMLHHTKIYSESLDYYQLRLNAKPGLTGLAQVKGYVGEINDIKDLKKRILNDIYYVRNSSISLNTFIIMMTFKKFFEKIILMGKLNKHR